MVNQNHFGSPVRASKLTEAAHTPEPANCDKNLPPAAIPLNIELTGRLACNRVDIVKAATVPTGPNRPPTEAG